PITDAVLKCKSVAKNAANAGPPLALRHHAEQLIDRHRARRIGIDVGIDFNQALIAEFLERARRGIATQNTYSPVVIALARAEPRAQFFDTRKHAGGPYAVNCASAIGGNDQP